MKACKQSEEIKTEERYQAKIVADLALALPGERKHSDGDGDLALPSLALQPTVQWRPLQSIQSLS